MEHFLRVRVREYRSQRAEVGERQAVDQIIMLARGNLNQTDLLLIGVQAVGFGVYRQRGRSAQVRQHFLQQRGGIHISRFFNVRPGHAGIITSAAEPRFPRINWRSLRSLWKH